MILLPALVPVAWFEWQTWSRLGTLGFPLDDAWIHAQFARNIAAGAGFSYNPGEWVSGSTAPAWTTLLGLGTVLLRDTVVASKVFGVALHLLTAVLAARLTEHLVGWRPAAIVAGLVVGWTPLLTWGAVSGMEVPLAAALVLAGLLAHAEQRRVGVSAGLLALGALARPETLAILGLLLADIGLRAVAGRTWRDGARQLGEALLVSALVLAPVVALDYATLGRPLPSTFYVKSGPGIVQALGTGDLAMARRALLTHAPAALWKFAEILREQLPLLVALLPIGAVVLATATRRRVGWLMVASLVLVPLAIGATSPDRLKPDNARYVPQLVALAGVVAIVGLAPVVRFLATSRILTAVACCLLLLPLADRVRAASAPYAQAVGNIEQMHVVMGRWLAANTPPDALVAVNDIGAIAYFGHRRILDLEGLVSPEALAYRRLGTGRGLALVEAMRPDYVVIFPTWFPDLMKATDRFTEVHRIAIVHNLVAGDSVMVAFRTEWADAR